MVLATAAAGAATASTDDDKLSAVAPAGIKKNNAKSGQFFVTIPANKTTAEIKLAAIYDKQNEPTEKAVLSIVPSNAYRSGDLQTVKISIKP